MPIENSFSNIFPKLELDYLAQGICRGINSRLNQVHPRAIPCATVASIRPPKHHAHIILSKINESISNHLTAQYANFGKASPYSDTTDLHNGPRALPCPDEAPDQGAQALIRGCKEIAEGAGLPAPEMMLDPSLGGRDVVQYYSEMHYATMMGEVVTGERIRRVTRVIVKEKGSPVDNRILLDALDPTDREYLTQKCAFSLPPKHYCEAFLQSYFRLAYPTCPVFDPYEFIQSYDSGTYSFFLLQAVLANAALFVPQKILEASGFASRAEAIEKFCTRAALLYDFNCEKSQLRLLQGSAVLAMTGFSGTGDKDFSYWYHNAIRLAIKMGIHHQGFNTHEIDSATYRLYQRIWWTLYSRDIMLLFSGVENKSLLGSSTESLTALPPVEMWVPENISPSCASVLPPLTLLESLYFVENCKLATIASHCLSVAKSGSPNSLAHIQEAFSTWHASVAEPLLPNPGQDPRDNPWHIVLIATSYRFQCMLFRWLRKHWEVKDSLLSENANSCLKLAMYELDAMIGRALAYDMLRNLPIAFLICAPAVLALHLEIVLKSAEPDELKSRSLIYIQQSLICMKQCRDLPQIEVALGVAEWVLAKKALLPNWSHEVVPNGETSHHTVQRSSRDWFYSAHNTESQSSQDDLAETDVTLDDFLVFGLPENMMFNY
ncbi:hypothetical protein N5P37_006504 [Trichoderma harzianum]|nr:hypothetical protein N5P37_006504 [Trichoderma harzianum]